MNICLFKSEEIKNSLKKNDERAKHIIKVLHKKEGDTFDAGIIGGAAGIATITSISEDGEISFSFEPKTAGKKLYPLTLIIGFPRPIQLRRLLRDVAGLGVQKVILCGTDLTEKSYLESNVVSDGSAYQMLLDGTAQAASTHVPLLEVAKSLDQVLKTSSPEWEMASKIALDNRRASSSLHDFLAHESAHSVIAAIGSERGWTERERDLLESADFSLCSMGSRILRTETAATVASSIILDAMGFLQ
ncbi:RsmE family RNA methyltransferase [Treponema ruminis]|uniref:Ribosomal RNA small subunit methyltransferase E n=1 Tax=Treponema ruminis TaxID=744515 RepID=A0A7W8LL08_9SPIR|nr:RsmE family RNA methyltransferase [Treponema ruminis]MBB5224987.1 RsmE family RNA methyltransferase [Treponema ruminis]